MRWVAVLGLVFGMLGSVWAWDESFDCLYGDAYQQGYRDGYTYQQPFPIEPFSPVTPFPRLGEDNHDAYGRGFLDGLQERQGRRRGFFW